MGDNAPNCMNAKINAEVQPTRRQTRPENKWNSKKCVKSEHLSHMLEVDVGTKQKSKTHVLRPPLNS